MPVTLMPAKLIKVEISSHESYTDCHWKVTEYVFEAV